MSFMNFLKNYERRKKSIVHKTIDQENINLIFQINIKNQILDISISDFIIFYINQDHFLQKY